VKSNLTATVWKDKQNVNILTNMHYPWLEGNFYDDHGKGVKLAIIQDTLGCVDKSDHMTNSYNISRRTGKWTKKLLFHLLDLSNHNSFIILACYGSILSHWQFRLTLVTDLI
jgi:hypothetical protein